MSWTSSDGDPATSSFGSPDTSAASSFSSPVSSARASSGHGSKWLRRIVLLIGVLAAGYFVAAYMKWLPPYIPNLLERFGLA